MVGRVGKEGEGHGFPAGVKRLVLAMAGVPVAVTMTTVMLAGPASAAPRSVQAAHVAAAPSSHVYRTKLASLRVRRRRTPQPRSWRTRCGRHQRTVNCYALGTAIGGDNVWYHITAPHAGDVAGFSTQHRPRPSRRHPACPVARAYRTKAKGLRVRAAANTSAKVLAVLGAAGTSVKYCYALGTAIGGEMSGTTSRRRMPATSPASFSTPAATQPPGIPRC